MTDIRLQHMAQVLVRYSLGVKKGDRLAITTGPVAAPLIREVVREALRAGAHPETFVGLPGVQEIVFKEASDEQLTYIPASFRMIIEEYETMLQPSSRSVIYCIPTWSAALPNRCAGLLQCSPPMPMPRTRRCR